MSLRNEQCNKVCRILDDVLANRPTERDSLITAVRKAFGALETEPQWIPVSWIENEIKWLKSLDNTFSEITALQISAMVKKWRDEQGETD